MDISTYQKPATTKHASKNIVQGSLYVTTLYYHYTSLYYTYYR